MAEDLAQAMRALADAMREVANENRALRNEMRAQRERKITTRRVKSAKRVSRLQDVPVDDIARASAGRLLAKFGR